MENYTPTTGSQIERMAKKRGLVNSDIKRQANLQRKKRRREAKKRRRVPGPVDVKEDNLDLHDGDDADDGGDHDDDGDRDSQNPDQNRPQQDQDDDEAHNDDIDDYAAEHREPLVIIVASFFIISWSDVIPTYCSFTDSD